MNRQELDTLTPEQYKAFVASTISNLVKANGIAYAIAFVSSQGVFIRLQAVDGFPNGFAIGDRMNYRELRQKYPDLVIVQDGIISKGGGIHVRRGEEDIFVNYPLVRGHSGPSQEEIDSLPEWAYQAYCWRADGGQ